MMTTVTELSVSASLGQPEDSRRAVLKLAGEADTTNREVLAQALADQAARKPSVLLVDVSELAFIDSAALHELIRTHRALQGEGGRLVLVGPTYSVTRILQLSGIDQVIPVCTSGGQASAVGSG